MNKYLAAAACIVAVLPLLSSCSSPAQPVTSALPGGQDVVLPHIFGIVGDSQVTPSSQSILKAEDNSAKAGNLSYSWTAEKGTIRGEGKQVTWTAPDALGECNVTLTVTSASGDRTSATKTFTVMKDPYGRNDPDTAVYLKLSFPSTIAAELPGRQAANTIADIRCSVSGIDPRDLSYTWSTTGGKLLGDGIREGKADRIGWLAPGTPGPFSVTVKVSDKSGKTATGQVNFDVYIQN